LENLENVFIGAPLSKPIGGKNSEMDKTKSQLTQNYANSTIMLEN
jgi:hypothetical protein